MREVAFALGHAILFPVFCKWCGRKVYLYAHPNGGFAIFEALGIPWPKHTCTYFDIDIELDPPGDPLSPDYSPFPITLIEARAAPACTGDLRGLVLLSAHARTQTLLYDGQRVSPLALDCSVWRGEVVDVRIDATGSPPMGTVMARFDPATVECGDWADLAPEPELPPWLLFRPNWHRQYQCADCERFFDAETVAVPHDCPHRRMLQVGNLTATTTLPSLKQAFARFGKVVCVEFEPSQDGIAYVTFDSSFALERALAITKPVILEGQCLRMERVFFDDDKTRE